jgi:hypothetical protein
MNIGKIHGSELTTTKEHMTTMLVASQITSNICAGLIVSVMIVARSQGSNVMERHGMHIGTVGTDGTETLDLCAGSVC